MTTTPELALEAVTHRYPGGVLALGGVDLRIGPGERVALVGQNGSGKSTLIRHLNGLLRPTSGRVLHDGADAAERTVAQLARDVGLVFQDPDRQIFAGSVNAEVRFGPRNLGLRGPELEYSVDRAIRAVGLEAEVDTNPYDLGASRRKLLSIASVLAMRTHVLVLDEPTTGQDMRGVDVVCHVVEEAHREGRTVIAVSHDMDFVAGTFDRVVVLRDGRLIEDGTPTEVFAAQRWSTLRSTYLEPPLAALVGERLGAGSTPTTESLLSALGRNARA